MIIMHKCPYSDLTVLDPGERIRGFKLVGITVICRECGQTVGTFQGANGELSLFPHEDPRRA